MADTLQTLALIVLAQNYKPDVVRQVNRTSALAKMLPLVRGEGKNVAFAVSSTGAIAETYAEGADPTNFGSDAQEAAVLNWAQYWAPFHVSGLSQAAAATSASPTGNVGMWARNLIDSGSALSSKINSELYVGPGTARTIAGLDVAIGTAANTYAGINRATSTYFESNQFNAAGPAAALTFAQIRSDMQAIYIASGYRPDVAMVHPNVLAKMATLFDPQKQYVFETTRDVTSAAGSFKLEGGIGGIRFDGCVFVEDKDATDGKIYYLNTQKVHLETLPMNLAMIPGMSDEVMSLVAGDGFGPLPFGFQLEMIGKTGDSDKAFMKSYLQLCVEQPNACGVRLNIA